MLDRMRNHIQQLALPNNRLTLHYCIATQETRVSDFITFSMPDDIISRLARYEPDKTLPALLTFVEHYLCCVFQTLPYNQLLVWLPPDTIRKPDIGLNVVPPVRPQFAAAEPFLLGSTDQEIKNYATSMSSAAVKKMESAGLEHITTKRFGETTLSFYHL